MKMEDEEVKVYVGMLKKIEESVKNGRDGLKEFWELVEWGDNIGLENERIITDLNVEVVKVLMVGVMTGYME